jgi:hypothetical protein
LPEKVVIGPLPAIGGTLSAAGQISRYSAASLPTFCHHVQNYDEGVLVMAVLIEEVFPVGVTIELLDAITDELGVDASLPPGGIVHVHFEKDGRAHGVDVWDSVETHEQFVQSTLMPAMAKVALASGLDLSSLGEPEVTITEVHRLVR